MSLPAMPCAVASVNARCTAASMSAAFPGSGFGTAMTEPD